jgi:hypothetical protein
MKKILLILFSLALFQSKTFCQTNISGIVNVYPAVLSYDSCNNNCMNVNSSVGFTIGDHVMVIQMKGMEINQTNTASFGSFVAYDSVGFYERAIILSISGNNICFTSDLAYKYKASGKIQLVKIARYPLGVNVVGTVQALAWDGSKGGLIAIETSGTLTMNADIVASNKGFIGGLSGAAIANSCNALTNVTDYATDSTTWQNKSFKGEGVANYVPNKWSSRGPQASGGGGGNDHNSGGGGGANLASGGIGGRNNEPGTFNCKGYQPGIGGLGLAALPKDRLFLGGGGGSGHQNNAVNFRGGNGGGIIYIKANTLVGNNRNIVANGDTSRMSGQDGGSGGGAGGSIKLDVLTFTGVLNVTANGGRGASTNNAASNRCFGPGGGGAGGVVHIKSASIPAGVNIQTLAGAPGVVFNSSNACNGSSNSASAGGVGSVTFLNNILAKSKSGITNCLMRRRAYSFDATQETNQEVYMQLNATSIDNGSIIVFQKSIDGQTFEDLLTISVNDFNPKGNFEAIDREPSIGKSFYRVKIVNNKKEQYLSDVYYFYNGLNWTEEDILVYPNPVLQNQKLTIEFPTTQHKMTLKVMDITGRILYDTKLTEEQTSTGHIEIDKYSNTSNKMLILQLSSDKGEVFTKKIIIIQ